MKKFGRIILRVLFISLACVPMCLGFFVRLVTDAFYAGWLNQKDFIRWL